MDLNPTEDQQAIAETVRRICDTWCTPAIVRAAENGDTDAVGRLWGQLREAGLTGLIIDPEHGGAGLSMLETVAVYDVLGQYLAPVPLFASSIVSALALARASESSIAAQRLPGVADGSVVIVPAWLEPEGGFSSAGIRMQAETLSGGYRLSGIKQHVPFAEMADAFIVPACITESGETGSRIELFLVDAGSPGLSVRPSRTLAGERQSVVEFRSVEIDPEHRLTEAGCGWTCWSDVVNEAIIADAAYAVGLADRALGMTVEYARDRKQFGQSIAAFQAISHSLVDCSVKVDGARTLVQEAAWANAEGYSYRAIAAMAALFARTTARDVTARAEQVHGGIGFTLDYDIQLYYRRAKQLQVNWWDRHFLEQRIAELVFERGESLSGPDPFAPSAEEIASLNRRV